MSRVRGVQREPFRLALIGAGMVARENHLPAASASLRVELTAIVDPVRERAARLAADFGLSPKVVSDYEEVLGEVDGVVIATPNDTHAAIAVACLEAGVSTLVEKPMASSAEEGVAILEAAERAETKHGTVAAIGYATRFRDNVLLLEELLKRRYFGRIERFFHQMGSRGGWAPESSYNLSKEATGGGVLMVTGTHFLDRMISFWGYPDEMRFWDDSAGGPEANCRAEFSYESSDGPFEGTALYSKSVDLPGGLVLKTEAGMVVLPERDGAAVILRPSEAPSLEHVIRSRTARAEWRRKSIFQRQLEDFVDAHQQGRPPIVDCRQGLLSQRLTADLYSRRCPLRSDWYPATNQEGEE